MEPELIQPDVETSYSDLLSQENQISSKSLNQYHNLHHQNNKPADIASHQEDTPHSPSPLPESPLQPPMPGDFQFPPHSDRHHTISRVGPVHSMSQIRTVPAIPSDTSLFSPPSHNRDFEQTENPEINHPDQEKYPYDSTQESSSLDNCLKTNAAQQFESLTPHKEKLTPNNHHDRNKKHENHKFRKDGSYSDAEYENESFNPHHSRNVTDASYNVVNSSTPYNQASLKQKQKSTNVAQNLIIGDKLSSNNNDYVTKKDLEVFIHGISDNIAKKIAHPEGSNKNIDSEKSSMYVPPIFSTSRAAGPNDESTFQIPSPHLSMSEDVQNRSFTYQKSGPTSYDLTTPSKKSTIGIESYLLSFPEGTEIFKSFLEGRPPMLTLFQSTKSNRNLGDSALNKSSPHAQSTPIKENTNVLGVNSSSKAIESDNTPLRYDQNSLLASIPAKTPDNNRPFRRASAVTFASTENIIPVEENANSYKNNDSQRTSLTEVDQPFFQKRENSLNTQQELDIGLLKEKIAQLEAENYRLEKKLESTQASLLDEIQRRNNDNNRNNETTKTLKDEVTKLSGTLKSSHENMIKQVSHITKKANERGVEVKALKAQVKLLIGTARPLTSQEMPDFKPGAKIPSALYERLDMPLIDTLGVIEARNFLKNIVMQTGVNLHRLENKIAGLISCVCMTDMYIQFVNDLNRALFKIPIDANIYPFGEERKRTMAQIMHEVQNLITHYKNTTTKINHFKQIKELSI